MFGPDRGGPPVLGVPPTPVRVFISYNRETEDQRFNERVVVLANNLRRHGVDARVDQYEMSPTEGWPLWVQRELEAADFVLAICTASYHRRFVGDETSSLARAVRWEGQILRQHLYEDDSFGSRVIPVLLEGSTSDCIPAQLRGQTSYQLPSDHDCLYRRLTNQPGIVKPPLGELRLHLDNLPEPPPNFVGRVHELAEISAFLTEAGSAALVQTISGLGGIGKTRLALEYAHHHARDYDIRWWLHAADLEKDLVDLGRELGILSQSDDIERSTPEILAWLRNHRRWLLIVDNADDPASLRDRLPLPAAGHILITSRARAWRGVAFSLEIQTLPPEAAVDLLLRRSGRASDSHVAAVARALGGLPLALVQAGAFVEQTGCTFGEYLQRLRHEGIDLLRSELGVTGDYYKETVATTWKLNFVFVRGELASAADLLDFLAFLDPNGVPLALLSEQVARLPRRVAALMTTPREFDQALALLRRFSLVDREGAALRVHRLVQAVVRDALGPASCLALAGVAVSWARAVLGYNPQDPHIGRVPASIAEQILCLSEMEECIQGASLPLVWALGNLGHYLLLAGQSTRAREATTRAVKIAETLVASDLTNTQAQRALAFSLEYLGEVEVQTGNTNTARTHFVRSLNVCEAITSNSIQSQRDLSIILDKLGSVEAQTGDLTTARIHLGRSIKLREALATAHPTSTLAQRDLTISLIRLGNLEMMIGTLATACAYYDRAFKLSETLTATDPNNAQALRDLSIHHNNLGDMELQSGNLATARTHYDRSLQICEALASADPASALHRRGLAFALDNLGKMEIRISNLAAARAYFDRSLMICEESAAPPNNLWVEFLSERTGLPG